MVSKTQTLRNNSNLIRRLLDQQFRGFSHVREGLFSFPLSQQFRLTSYFNQFFHQVYL